MDCDASVALRARPRNQRFVMISESATTAAAVKMISHSIGTSDGTPCKGRPYGVMPRSSCTSKSQTVPAYRVVSPTVMRSAIVQSNAPE